MPKLLELFKGTGSVGKEAKKLGYSVVSLDNLEKYKPDILTDILKWDYKKWSEDNNYIPDYIWASPPCNTYSPLVYPLKERCPKTAKPYSERAKTGTKILYKTLEIINYFKSKNPKLLYVIENPRGMMRKDSRMKKLPYLSTTYYCYYGDNRRKPTDFWSNYPLGLIEVLEPCEDYVKIQDIPLNDRYKIPAKLVKQIIYNAVKKIKKI
jgi:site-specific DNA-cytosine methylase